jgi:hypothetical protein
MSPFGEIGIESELMELGRQPLVPSAAVTVTEGEAAESAADLEDEADDSFAAEESAEEEGAPEEI